LQRHILLGEPALVESILQFRHLIYRLRKPSDWA
jgi:hypothetical protein